MHRVSGVLGVVKLIDYFERHDSSIIVIVERVNDIPNSFSAVTLVWAASRVYILDRNGAKMRMVGENPGKYYVIKSINVT